MFAIAIQNINESYGEVKAYRGRISVALAMQSRSAVFTPSHNNTPGGTPDDGDMIEDGHMDITEMNVRRDMKNVFCVSDFISGKASKSDTSLAAKMDCNEFVIEVLLRCNAIDYDTDLEPILTVSPLQIRSQHIQSLLTISPSHLSFSFLLLLFLIMPSQHIEFFLACSTYDVHFSDLIHPTLSSMLLSSAFAWS